ncbi:serine acetyltransferase [Sphingomonas sp. dw_22]|uniref:serine acetyltransferase n=1 Tax=Sphingomonas sp. dw_22 TaxID=2721175 RepID=UPI001BD2ED7D|nr:serine acetyltransferase [Sphingomonas sp. dw_22]
MDAVAGALAPEQEDGNETGKPHRRGCPVSFAKLKALLAADLYRYAGRVSFGAFVRHYAFTPGYKYTVLMRTCGWLKLKPMKGFGLFPIVKLLLLRARYKYGFAIPEYTEIGPGLFLNRFGGFYFHGDTVIGTNVNVTHGVVLGYMNRGARRGAPVIGDRTFLGSGAKVIGGIEIGADSAVGANAVVTKDVPPRGVVGGIPAKLLSDQGSDGYINRMAPPEMLAACEGALHGWLERPGKAS